MAMFGGHRIKADKKAGAGGATKVPFSCIQNQTLLVQLRLVSILVVCAFIYGHAPLRETAEWIASRSRSHVLAQVHMSDLELRLHDPQRRDDEACPSFRFWQRWSQNYIRAGRAKTSQMCAALGIAHETTLGPKKPNRVQYT